MPPKLSVIIPVYNAEKTIGNAIESALNQSFKDFQLLIVNDGSNDNTSAIIDSFDDNRIRHIELPKNYGTIAAANLCLAEVEAPLIARLDADCIALQDRFKLQYEYMMQHPEIGVCGSAVKIAGTKKIISYKENRDAVVASMLFENPIPDSSSIFRTYLMREKGFRYRDQYPGIAEYDLWYRMRNITLFTNLDEVLTEIPPKPRIPDADRHEVMSSFFVEKLNDMGILPNVTELELHNDLSAPEQKKHFSEPIQYREWLDKLKTSNQIVYSFPRIAFNLEIENRWYRLFKSLEVNDFYKSIQWLRIQGKSDPFIWRYKMKKVLGL